MQIFISWSGQLARDMASALSSWLPIVVQSVEPWHSDKDIVIGTDWHREIGRALDRTDYGIVCVTRENLSSCWLMFEAGALAKRQDAHVVPLYIDLDRSDVPAPLGVRQGVALDEKGIRQLVLSLHEHSRSSLSQEQIKKLFDRMWPDLREAIDAVKQKVPAAESIPELASLKSVVEVLDEDPDKAKRLSVTAPKTSTKPTVSVRDGAAGGAATAKQVFDVKAYRQRLRFCAPFAMRNLTEMRLAVEPVAASLAATRASAPQRRTLVRLSAQMQKEAGLVAFSHEDTIGEACRERFRSADLEFHRTLLAASGNEFFCGLASHVDLALTYRIRSDRDRDGARTREESAETKRYPSYPSRLSLCLHRLLAIAVAQSLPHAAEVFSRAQICEVRPGLLPTLVAQALPHALQELDQRSMGPSKQDWETFESEITIAVAAVTSRA